jgi:hypothetical protein
LFRAASALGIRSPELSPSRRPYPSRGHCRLTPTGVTSRLRGFVGRVSPPSSALRLKVRSHLGRGFPSAMVDALLSLLFPSRAFAPSPPDPVAQQTRTSGAPSSSRERPSSPSRSSELATESRNRQAGTALDVRPLRLAPPEGVERRPNLRVSSRGEIGICPSRDRLPSWGLLPRRRPTTLRDPERSRASRVRPEGRFGFASGRTSRRRAATHPS